MKFTAILLPVALCLALPGCAGSFSKVSGAMKDAPDWYEDRRKEVRGEGYPDLSEIPEISNDETPGKALPLTAERMASIIAQFEAAEAEVNAAPSLEQRAARFQAIETSLDAAARAPGARMTEAQADAIRKKFDVPRVTEPFKGQK